MFPEGFEWLAENLSCFRRDSSGFRRVSGVSRGIREVFGGFRVFPVGFECFSEGFGYFLRDLGDFRSDSVVSRGFGMFP